MTQSAAMFAIIRNLPGNSAPPIPAAALAASAGISLNSLQVYISRIRQECGFTAIAGTPSRGYRLGEWPGHDVPCRRYQRQPVTPSRPEFDSSAGVIVTEAGRRLGL